VIHTRAQLGLGMHRVERKNPPFDERRREKGLEGADLVLLFLDVDLEKDDASVDIVGTELMHGWPRGWLPALLFHQWRASRMRKMPRRCLQRLGSFPQREVVSKPGEEGRQEFIEHLSINTI